MRTQEYKDRAYAAIAAYKREVGCARCGYNEEPDAMEFDHINGGRPVSVGVRTLGWLERIKADPNVQVLCGNCHNIKSVRERRR